MMFTLAPAVLFYAACAAAESGLSCPYINTACTLKPPVEAECKPFEFGLCSKAPSTLADYYYITTLEGENITFKRFNSTDCAENTIEAQWTSQGPLGGCIGPVDSKLGFDAYVEITMASNANTTSTMPTSAANATSTTTASPTTTTETHNATTTQTQAATTTSSTVTTSATAGQTTDSGSAAGVVLPGVFGVVVAVVSAMLL